MNTIPLSNHSLNTNSNQFHEFDKFTNKPLLLITDYGFVFIGYLSNVTEDTIQLTSSYHVTNWGSSEGIFQLALKGITKSTVMTKIGTVKVNHNFINSIAIITPEVASIHYKQYQYELNNEDYQAVILTSGWVFVGIPESKPTIIPKQKYHTLYNAQAIRSWGDGTLGNIILESLPANAIIDPVGVVHYNDRMEIAVIPLGSNSSLLD